MTEETSLYPKKGGKMTIYSTNEKGEVVSFFSGRRVTPEEEILVLATRELKKEKEAKKERGRGFRQLNSNI